MVSVIVPCYNQAHYLSQALDSLLSQTFRDWECIIVNDGSPDTTDEVARQYVEKDSRFKYLVKENGGLSSARNAGINQAAGKYILPLDADDWIAPTFLEAGIEFLNSHAGYGIVYSGTALFGTETGVRNEEFSVRKCLVENLIPCTALYHKSDWATVGGYDEEMKSGYEDWDFWLRLIKKGVLVKKIPEVLFYYRRQETSMSRQMTAEIIYELRTSFYHKYSDLYLKVLGSPLDLELQRLDLCRQLEIIKHSGSYNLALKLTGLKRIFRRG